MGKSDAVSDAGPVIHLDQLGCLDLMAGFHSLWLTDVIWQEVTRFRPLLQLDRMVEGTRIVPALEGQSASDLSSRALSLGLHVHGTVGLIVRALRRGTRTLEQVRALLTELPAKSSLHIDPRFLRQVIAALPGAE